MNKHHQTSTGAHHGAQPKRTIPVPRIVKPGHAATNANAAQAKVDPTRPLKPANVMKAANTQKHAPWLTTAKIPRVAIPKIP
jgi:hypothetical protein